MKDIFGTNNIEMSVTCASLDICGKHSDQGEVYYRAQYVPKVTESVDFLYLKTTNGLHF